MRLERQRKKEAVQAYESRLEEITEEYRDRILSRLPNILPSQYQPAIGTMAILANDWFNVTLPPPPHAEYPSIHLDPFLAETIRYWNSNRPWDQMRLIRHFTDARYFKDAVELSITLEQNAMELLLARAIRVSRLRALSISGLGDEAEKLGRELYAERGRLDKYLAFTLWGHYRRWPSLDNDEKLREWLMAFFNEIQQWPSKSDDHDVEKLDWEVILEIRELLRQ